MGVERLGECGVFVWVDVVELLVVRGVDFVFGVV